MEAVVEVAAVIGMLVLLEGLLSADNALVLAVIVRGLPKDRQRKALFYGLGGAFAFRGVALLLASYVIRLWYLRALGAVYLLYVAVKHFVQRKTEAAAHAKVYPSFWRTVVTIEVMDIAFAVDSVLVAVAMSDKLWVIYAGVGLGIVAMRVAAGFFVKLLDRFPSIEHAAYVLVAWVGLKLASQSIDAYRESVIGTHAMHLMPRWAFWVGMGIIVVGTALWVAVRDHQATESKSQERSDA